MTKMNYKSTTNRYINPVTYKPKEKNQFLSLNSESPFGKYKSKKVIDIINQDYGYILWCKREHVFIFNDDVLLLIKEKKSSNINHTPREYAPYVKVERKACCKYVYVFDDKDNQIMSFESVVKAAEYFKINKSLLSYYIRNRKRIEDKYLLSYSEFLLFID